MPSKHLLQEIKVPNTDINLRPSFLGFKLIHKTAKPKKSNFYFSSEYKDVYNSLMFQTTNHYLHTFDYSTLLFTAPISKLGNCLVKAEIYQNLKKSEKTKKVFFRLSISEPQSRLKTIILVFNNFDMLAVIDIDPCTFILSKTKTIQNCTLFLKKFIFEKSKSFKKL